MKNLKYIVIFLIFIYAFPAFISLLFSSEVYRGEKSWSRTISTFLLFSPYILLAVAVFLPFLIKFDNTKFIISIPLICIFMWVIFYGYIGVVNKIENKISIDEYNQQIQELVNLMPTKLINNESKFYLGSKISTGSEVKIYLLALQSPLSELRDIFSNRDILDNQEKKTQLEIWLIIIEDQDTKIYSTGTLDGYYLNPNYFSNLYPYKSEEPRIVLQKDSKKLDILVDPSKLPLLAMENDGKTIEFKFEELKDALNSKTID